MAGFVKAALLAWLFLVSPLCRAGEPVEVALCELLSNAGAYNHQLVKVVGQVSRGFEVFQLSTRGCGVWLELGGTTGSQVVFCCGVSADPERRKPLVVEGVATTLAKDEPFERFQSLTLKRAGLGQADATLIGRFFSGKQQSLDSGRSMWMGYGHLGMYSLLVVEQVVSVGPSKSSAE